MSKDEVLQKLFEIVRWDYQEGADEKYPCPFPKDVNKHVKKLLREAEAHLTQRALDEMPCGHPQSFVVSSNEGTQYCSLCEAASRQ